MKSVLKMREDLPSERNVEETQSTPPSEEKVKNVEGDAGAAARNVATAAAKDAMSVEEL